MESIYKYIKDESFISKFLNKWYIAYQGRTGVKNVHLPLRIYGGSVKVDTQKRG